MTSPQWMILVCFSLISVFGTGESLTPIKPSIIFRMGESLTLIKPSKTVAPSSLAAIIAGMSKPIADLNASYNKLLAQKKGISCPCNASMIQACNNQRNLLKQGLISCDSQLGSANVQRSSLQQQVNVLNSQLRSEIAQRTSLQQQVNVLNSQLRSEIVQRNSLPQVNVLNSQLRSEIARRTSLQQQVNDLNSQLSSANAQRSSQQQQLNDLNSQLSSANAQRSSLQQQVNDLKSQLTLVTKQRDALQSQINVFTRPQNERWQSFNGHLYYLSTTTADWQTSRNDCLSKGADLLIINDAAENDFARGLNRKAWMGLKKSGSTWTWVDGSILLPSVSYWGPGEPNNQLNLEDRAEIGFFANSVNSWNDTPGTTINYWICEKKAV